MTDVDYLKCPTCNEVRNVRRRNQLTEEELATKPIRVFLCGKCAGIFLSKDDEPLHLITSEELYLLSRVNEEMFIDLMANAFLTWREQRQEKANAN